MELRGYGKHNKRTWYSGKDLKAVDYIAIAVSFVILLISLYMRFFVVKSLYFNPFA